MSIDDRHFDESSCGQDAAPYVLGALTDAEHEAFVAHMKDCMICREEVASLQSVVLVLPAAVPQVQATQELKRRVMATVKSESGLRGAGEAVSTGEASKRALPRLAWRPLLAPLGAAVVLAVAVVIALSGGGSQPTKVIRAQVTLPRASVSVRVNAGHAELNVADMPQSPPNHVYEVWVKRNGNPQPTDALFTVSSTGAATVGVPGSLKGVKQILVTAEPTGGSKVPTSTPVIVANLS